MERMLRGLTPEKVFFYFEEISKIPRGSGNEEEVSEYIFDLAIRKGWDVLQDDYLNIIIKKHATRGYEDAPTVMLQGHMDMVCEKNEGVLHDFERDPIKLKIADGFVCASDTTLGADNGIGVAMALAILDSHDLEHPALEVLFTVDEEKDMTGAQKVDGKIFKSKYLINLDSDIEGVFISGCAGGCDVTVKIPAEYEATELPCYKISVKGLLGGHSGIDIHKERGNANKILGRVLYDIIEDVDLINIYGGSKINAIPREASAIIVTDKVRKIKDKIEFWDSIIKNEHSFTDPDVKVYIEEINILQKPVKLIKKDIFRKVVAMINVMPNGVLSRNAEIDLVISSNNLGVIKTDEKYIKMLMTARSSIKTLLKNDFEPLVKQLALSIGVECVVDGYYPGWEYAKNSKIRDIFVETYREMYEEEPIVEAVHAGLECGLLMEKVPGLDAIAIGPDTWNVHSPKEKLSIESTESTYKFLCEVLKKIR